jgi:hypothetical protein
MYQVVKQLVPLLKKYDILFVMCNDLSKIKQTFTANNIKEISHKNYDVIYVVSNKPASNKRC